MICIKYEREIDWNACVFIKGELKRDYSEPQVAYAWNFFIFSGKMDLLGLGWLVGEAACALSF